MYRNPRNPMGHREDKAQGVWSSSFLSRQEGIGSGVSKMANCAANPRDSCHQILSRINQKSKVHFFGGSFASFVLF